MSMMGGARSAATAISWKVPTPIAPRQAENARASHPL
jgi:hypothetical protein